MIKAYIYQVTAHGKLDGNQLNGIQNQFKEISDLTKGSKRKIELAVENYRNNPENRHQSGYLILIFKCKNDDEMNSNYSLIGVVAPNSKKIIWFDEK